VHARQDPDQRLTALARSQAGVLSTGQAGELGVGRHSVARLVAAGRWRRLDRSVYFVHPDEPTWLAWAWAGLLVASPGARLSGLSAAHLHGLHEPEPWPLALLVPHDRPVRSRPPWVFRRERSGVRDQRSPGSPPRSTVEDTVLDLTGEGSAEAAIDWLTRAVQSRRTTVPRLRRSLEQRTRVRYRHLLLDLLADVAEGAETPLELAYLHDVERAHGLPRGVRQHRSRAAPHLRDVYYDPCALVVELDGRLGHEGFGRFRDMHRDNVGTVSGELTLRYGWRDVTGDPCAVAWQVAAVLARRGWSGLPGRCQRCRHVPSKLIG